MPFFRSFRGNTLGLLLGLLATLPALAQTPAPPPAPTFTPAADTPRPRVALVLSGGGARGFAHVGVLKALEAARVPVDLVVGTSMGAIIGGLYAAGLNPDELERELLAVEWSAIFNTREPRQMLSQRRKEEDFEFSPVLQLGFRDGEFRLPTGAVSSRSLEMLLRRYTLGTRQLRDFDALPTPFRAIATDMENGQAVVLERGDLAAALRASMSVPGVFAPLEVDGRILGDGGLVNNLPVDVARRLGADAVIAVNIGTPLAGRETLGSVIGVSAQMINILTEQNVQRSLASLTPRDLLLAPPLGRLSSADFDKASDLVALGRDFASKAGPDLARFAVAPADYEAWRAQRRQASNAHPPPTQLAFVGIEGVKPERVPRLRTQIEASAGQAMDPALAEQDLQRLAASGDYMRADYRLATTADGEGLVYQLTEKDWGRNHFRLGLDLRTDFQGQGAFNLRISHNRHWINDQGAEWRNRVQLGEKSGLYSELYQPLDRSAGYFVSGYVDHWLRRFDLYDADNNVAVVYRRRESRLGLDLGTTLGRDGAFGDARLGWFGARRVTTPEIIAGFDSGEIERLAWNEQGLRLAVVSDQLDYANFPLAGYRVRAEAITGRRDLLGARQGFHRQELTATYVSSFDRDTFNLHLRLARSSSLPVGALDEYSLGGFQQLSGYRVGQVVGNNLLFTRLTHYRRLDLNPGIARALFAGGSLELGNAWPRGSAMRLRDLRLGSSLFLGADTAVGPVYLALVHAPRGFTGVYFFLGRP
ncbi:patatin-like phospholipase family protein [Hydrogenophaga sp. OTU3427]|uniref:patatin-like phospholipase family protein n=1 Tax=Hydrogenophaga sp. OTU3427 TaxID=3043856 RepID=UPI00313DBAB6